jgi:hypothetical protein
MVFLGFGYVCKKLNIFLYFQNKMMLKIKECLNVSERCFLWFNWIGVHGFTCLLSQSYGGIKRNADDRNVDIILLCYLIIFI